MKEIIKVNLERCTGCARCIRECPMEMANIAYRDEAGDTKVKADHSRCIVCGRCIKACKHEARYYSDDTHRFFQDVKAGLAVSVMIAPAVRTNIPEYKRLITYLKSIGVKKVYDVSLGADICIWAHIRHLQKTKGSGFITQPCPVIVSYCRIFRHDLLQRLLPVHSPMGCLAVYMREYQGIKGNIAAISPCIAKTNEFDEDDNIQYNVTFASLLEYLELNNIGLPQEETEFDGRADALGALFPMPGGLKENIEFFLGDDINIVRGEGYNVYDNLNIFGGTKKEFLPDIYDALSCTEGCNIGSGCADDNDIFTVNSAMRACRKSAKNRGKEYFERLYNDYDKKLDLSLFIKTHTPVEGGLKEITNQDIQNAFALLGKNDFYKQNIDCGGCGSDTCFDMARKIALNVNIPDNCVMRAIDVAREEHEKHLLEYQKNVESNKTIQDMLQRFETIWQRVESGIVVVDAETRQILDVNPVAMRMFGDSRESIIGSTCNKMICPAQKCPVLDLNQEVDRSERKFVTCEGKIIPIIKSVARINYNGRPALLESFTDISYLKEAEEQLRMVKVAEEASQTKSDFLSRMSHEMRTPMNAIIGMAKIAEKTNDIDKLRYCFNKIEISSEHLLGLINDILDMSKIEAGKLELNHAALNLEKMLVKVCTFIGEKVEQKKIKFNIDLSRNMRMHYMGDELRLSQVIINLLSNAVKFTPENGAIELKIDETETGGDYSVLRFCVKDTGIGITAEQISRLFNAFEQADGGTARKYGGTGLGLAISKNIVEKMDGKIWVESEAGKGSSFIFNVKLKRAKAAEDIRLFRNISPQDIRVLVVDRDENEVDYFKSVTAGFNIKTDTAESGDGAAGLIKLAKSRHKPYDIIFVGFDYSAEEGFKNLNAVKELTDNKTAIVAMSSFLKWNNLESRLYSAGVSKFVFTPVFPSSVLDAINEAVGDSAKSIDVPLQKQGEIPDFSRVNILFAEDIEINREIFTALLEDTKINIDCAENGLIAVNKFKQNPDKYDLVIMDIQMPEMDGLEASAAIRALDTERAKAIPIIAMTANAFKEDIDKCIAAGMNGHLSKPIDIKALMGKILEYAMNESKK